MLVERVSRASGGQRILLLQGVFQVVFGQCRARLISLLLEQVLLRQGQQLAPFHLLLRLGGRDRLNGGQVLVLELIRAHQTQISQSILYFIFDVILLNDLGFKIGCLQLCSILLVDRLIGE